MTSVQGHAYYRELLERHLDGDLAPGERESLFNHLEFCDECRATLEAEERLLERLRSVPKLVAPSTLRANIVDQAMRERHERRTPLISDPRFASLLDAVAEENKTAREESAESMWPDRNVRPTAGVDGEGNSTEQLPTFVGVRQPRPSRVRQTWRRVSPYAAYTFLVIAATGALYTGDLRGVPVAHQLQTAFNISFRSAFAYVTGRHAEDDSLSPVTNPVASVRPNDRGPTASPSPLPPVDTAAASRLADAFRTRLVTARSAMAALARAADGTYPGPAELSAPQVAAIILKPSDARERLGFESDALGDALAQASSSDNNVVAAAAATPDQFAYDGHRYRTYVVRVSGDKLQNVVHALEQYRVPPDDGVLQALSSQNRLQFSTRRGQVAFFSSGTDKLRAALDDLRPSSGAGPVAEPVKIVVVE